MHALKTSAALLAVALPSVLASVTIYTQIGDPTQTINTAAAAYTGAAAYDPTTLLAPTPGDVGGAMGIQLVTGGPQGLSKPHLGSFMGFSIELSVANQVFGRNSQHIEVPFLNLMGNIRNRAGRVIIRLGGNTQEKATLHTDPLVNNTLMQKGPGTPTNPSPVIDYSLDLIYLMGNISSLVNADWVVGYPFANINPPVNDLVRYSTQILGDHLLAVQVGNEPDRYHKTGNRNEDYQPQGYTDDFGTVMRSLASDPVIGQKANYIGGSVCCDWTPEQVWDTGFFDAYQSQLAAVAVEQYPNSNCVYDDQGHHIEKDTQPLFKDYLTHGAAKGFIGKYVNTANLAQQHGKGVYLLETNTASCSGFKGISNSFGAALWGIDHALNLAAHNFTGGNFHVGGQDAYYNPFTPPPTNQSTFRKWTVGSVYYSSLVTSEVFGKSGKAQIIDMTGGDENDNTPAYAIYEDGQPTRVGILNFNTDPSGGHDKTVNIWVGGSGVGQPNASPASVKVKYLRSPNNTVSDLTGFTWANQTYGSAAFASDGRPVGGEIIETVPCDTASNTCTVKVPAPGFALVFLSDAALANSAPTADESTATFATSALTKIQNTVTVDQAVLATSNGHGGGQRQIGSTSFGSAHGLDDESSSVRLVVGLSTLFSALTGALLIGRMLR